MKIGRNDPCPCESGKKYKKCCWTKDEATRVEQAAANNAQAEAQQAAQLEDAQKSTATGAGSGSLSRPKGLPPKTPTQFRRRAV